MSPSQMGSLSKPNFPKRAGTDRSLARSDLAKSLATISASIVRGQRSAAMTNASQYSLILKRLRRLLYISGIVLQLSTYENVRMDAAPHR